jgi:hypothetical protein
MSSVASRPPSLRLLALARDRPPPPRRPAIAAVDAARQGRQTHRDGYESCRHAHYEPPLRPWTPARHGRQTPRNGYESRQTRSSRQTPRGPAQRQRRARRAGAVARAGPARHHDPGTRREEEHQAELSLPCAPRPRARKQGREERARLVSEGLAIARERSRRLRQSVRVRRKRRLRRLTGFGLACCHCLLAVCSCRAWCRAQLQRTSSFGAQAGYVWPASLADSADRLALVLLTCCKFAE